jgi:hypothetical protein
VMSHVGSALGLLGLMGRLAHHRLSPDHKTFFCRSTLSLLVSLAPRGVILHTKANKGRAIAVHQGFGEFKDQRVFGINSNIHFTAQDEIPLWIVLRDTVDECRAAKGVGVYQERPTNDR